LGARVNPDNIGCVWTGEFGLTTLRVDGESFESGMKKLRIQKYPDTCGRGLRRDNGGKFALYARQVVPPYWFIVRCNNLKLHQTLEVKNILKQEKIIFQSTFNPGWRVTGFRTTLPRTQNWVSLTSIRYTKIADAKTKYSVSLKNTNNRRTPSLELRTDSSSFFTFLSETPLPRTTMILIFLLNLIGCLQQLPRPGWELLYSHSWWFVVVLNTHCISIFCFRKLPTVISSNCFLFVAFFFVRKRFK